MALVLSIGILLFVLQVQGGPIQSGQRLVREVYPEIEPAENDGNQAQVCIVGDVVYGIDEPVPAEQPCLKCRCQPPGVQCETIKCAKKPGCKAIHRPNKCCPDYQCECHHEGRIYANGERLKSPPGGECKVCYCRGGEVQCANVSCYVRTDCQAKTVPGQCCPKYDHCPPKEPLTERNSTLIVDVNTKVLELWPLNALLNSTKEVSPNSESNKIENESVTIDNSIKITRPEDDLNKQIEQPKITIQEIIPEIREIPITTPVKPESVDFVDNSTNDLLAADSEPDSSEISEVFQHPPPVLRIGDKLLFLKQGEFVQDKDASTPNTIITIIGAEGLQRGFEDSAETHNPKPNDATVNSNDLELKTAESTHILSLVKRKNKPEVPTSTLVPTSSSTLPPTSTTSAPIEATTETTTKINLTTTGEPESVTATTTEIESSTETNVKILPEILEIRKNNSLPQNASKEEWLKNENVSLINLRAALPEEVLKAEAPSDLEAEEEIPSTTIFTSTISETTTEEMTVSPTESIEEMEQTSESGETVTVPSNHSLILSEENASVESSPASSELEDMTKATTNSPQLMDDVEILGDSTQKPEHVESTTMNEDVELIAVNETVANTDKPVRIIDKRENSRQDEEDEVFRQLNAELNADNPETSTQLSEDEEREQSNRIFKELLEETSTPKPKRKNLDKDAEMLERVSDAIAKLTLRAHRSNRFDPSILGVITDFFGSQYKQH